MREKKRALNKARNAIQAEEALQQSLKQQSEDNHNMVPRALEDNSRVSEDNARIAKQAIQDNANLVKEESQSIDRAKEHKTKASGIELELEYREKVLSRRQQ